MAPPSQNPRTLPKMTDTLAIDGHRLPTFGIGVEGPWTRQRTSVNAVI